MIVELLALIGPSIVVVVFYLVYVKKVTRIHPASKANHNYSDCVAQKHSDLSPKTRLAGLRDITQEKVRQNKAEQKIHRKIEEINQAIQRLNKTKK